MTFNWQPALLVAVAGFFLVANWKSLREKMNTGDAGDGITRTKTPIKFWLGVAGDGLTAFCAFAGVLSGVVFTFVKLP